MARIRLKPIVHAVTVFTANRSDSKRQQLVLITIVSILLQAVLLGYLSVFSLYLYGRPICMDALHVSLLSTAQAIVVFLLSIPIAFIKKTLDGTYLVPVLGSLAVIIDLIILSFAKKIWLLYIGNNLDIHTIIFFYDIVFLLFLQLFALEVYSLSHCLYFERN